MEVASASLQASSLQTQVQGLRLFVIGDAVANLSGFRVKGFGRQ